MKITRYNKQIEMTLDEVWAECIRMWHDCCFHEPYRNLDIIAAKIKWLKDNGYHGNIISSCFFCNHVYGTGVGCEKCPGVVVDFLFRCWHDKYDWETNRIAFYNKLVELNIIRLGQQPGQKQRMCLAKPTRSLKMALRYFVPRRLTLKTNPRVHAWLWWNF